MLYENAYDVDSEDEEKRMPDYQNFLEQSIENDETSYPSNNNIYDNHFELFEVEIYNYDDEEYRDNDLIRALNYESDSEDDYDSNETEILEESEIEGEDEDYHLSMN